MPSIKGNVFYGFYDDEIGEDKTCIVPDNITIIQKIRTFKENYTEININYKVGRLVIGKNVNLIYTDAFSSIYIKELYIFKGNSTYRWYISSIERLDNIEKICYVENDNQENLKYYDLNYDEDAVYTSKVILNNKKMEISKWNMPRIIGGIQTEIVDFYDEYPNFPQKEVYTFNSDDSEIAIFFKIKRDIDGYLFAEDIVTKEILPIICYKDGYLRQSTAIKEMSCGIPLGGIRLATSSELSYISKIDALRNRKFKNKYLKLISEINTRVKYYKNVDFSEPKEIELITKKRKSDIIEDVRTLLLKVGDINTEIYKQYYNKFKELLNLENTEDIENKLINLSAELQLYLSCNIISFSENSNLVDNINKLSSTYYDRLVNKDSNEEDSLYLPQNIDAIANLVIKNINNMSYLEVDNISKNIAFMYFAEIKLVLENNGQVDIKNNPYLEYFKKYIYYIIKTMLINGYIKLDINADIENFDLIRLIEDIDITNLMGEVKKKVLAFDLS